MTTVDAIRLGLVAVIIAMPRFDARGLYRRLASEVASALAPAEERIASKAKQLNEVLGVILPTVLRAGANDAALVRAMHVPGGALAAPSHNPAGSGGIKPVLHPVHVRLAVVVSFRLPIVTTLMPLLGPANIFRVTRAATSRIEEICFSAGGRRARFT